MYLVAQSWQSLDCVGHRKPGMAVPIADSRMLVGDDVDLMTADGELVDFIADLRR